MSSGNSGGALASSIRRRRSSSCLSSEVGACDEDARSASVGADGPATSASSTVSGDDGEANGGRGVSWAS